MTELLSRDLSRRTFLKGGGAMVVGFSLAGTAATKASAAEDPYASNGPYDMAAVDSWITIHADNTATVKVGVVELGQGTLTGLLMIAGEELDMGMDQLKYVRHDTNVTPNQGSTVGSRGIQRGGQQVRAAAAAAKGALLDLAAKELGVAKSSLSVSRGVVSGGGKSVTYGALLGDKLFNVSIPGGGATRPAAKAAGASGTKPVSQYKLVGTRGVPRVDIPAKVNGEFTYVHNIKVPGMLHGRVVRPRGQGAYGDGTAPKILSVDQSSIRHIPGVRVVRHGNFLGVVAPTEYDAIQAAAQLKVKWADPPVLPTSGNLWKQMRQHDEQGLAPARIVVDQGNFEQGFASSAKQLSATYTYAYNGHLPIGPAAAVAVVTPQGARIFSNTQDAYGTREGVKEVLDAVLANPLPLNRIRVSYYEGSSVYGSAPYRDVAQSAAIMAAIVGKPVRLQFMRWDEHGWDNYGPAEMIDVRGGVDANGNISAFEVTEFGIPYYSTHPAQQQVTGKASFSSRGHFGDTLTGAQYEIANWKVIGKTLPLENNYFKVTYLRAPNAPQRSFAAEQMADELAHAAGMDPVAFRLQNIAGTKSDPSQRWRNVLTRVAAQSGWQSRPAASRLSSANVVTGRGVAFGFYSNTPAAGVVHITVNKKTGKISVQSAHVVTDAGLVAYPDGMDNNEEGAVVQGISRALSEQVVFNRKGVTSLDWVGYPILRFKDAPKVHIGTVSRTDVPEPGGDGVRTTGAGEPGLTPIPAAIANAFFDATGVRIRQAPMTPARVRAVLKAARR